MVDTGAILLLCRLSNAQSQRQLKMEKIKLPATSRLEGNLTKLPEIVNNTSHYCLLKWYWKKIIQNEIFHTAACSKPRAIGDLQSSPMGAQRKSQTAGKDYSKKFETSAAHAKEFTWRRNIFFVRSRCHVALMNKTKSSAFEQLSNGVIRDWISLWCSQWSGQSKIIVTNGRGSLKNIRSLQRLWKLRF